MARIQSPPGMHDVLPDAYRWVNYLETIFSRVAEAYGFSRMETTMAEFEEVFTRGIGTATDVVEKQMYTFRTRGRDKLALRPEGTAGIVRAYLQHGMRTWPQPVRLWYMGPMFRYERPQAGRYRQFWQAGFETLGEEEAIVDAEILVLTTLALRELGLKLFSVHVNSLGCGQCRPVYRKIFVGYLRSRQTQLCAQCRQRMKVNPLRVLDCKEERCRQVVEGAPETFDHLCEACRAHFRVFLEYLEELKVSYNVNSRIVRGLDYYTRTVFEVFPGSENETEKPSQSALVSGGRYDPLFRALGGRQTGGVGTAFGVERIIAALKEAGVELPTPQPPQVFLAQLGEQAKRKAPALFEELRQSRFRIRASFGRDSIKSQLRIADKLGAPFVIILGQKEVSDETVILRAMSTGAQETVKRSQLVQTLRERLRKA